MEHRVKVTVLDKKLFPELQAQYCAVLDSEKCPCCNDGTRPVIFKMERIDIGD